jgi:Flp pilus assembly protein TadG
MGTYRRVPNLRRGAKGQALVEFSLILVPFFLLILGIIDVGRGIYVYNGAAQAAREIARVTSVYPGAPLGSSSETQDVVATQEGLVPGLGASGITIECTAMDNTLKPGECFTGTTNRYVRVTVNVPFNVIYRTFLPVIPTMTFNAVSHIQLP